MLHADGKRQDEFGRTVERMPVLISGFGDNEEHLLDIPITKAGTGKSLAQTS